MARSIEEIQADIAKVKQRIASREQNQYRQPQSRAGWGSYIISGDRGMLDAYQNRENAWNTMMEQQMFQAEQNAKNRRLQERLAKENKATAMDDKRAAAEDRLAKLKILREGIASKGGDTRETDIDIERIYKTYPDLKPIDNETDFDPRQTVDYVLADAESYNAKDNSVEELESMASEVAKFNTPESIKALNRLDKEIKTRKKNDLTGKTIRDAIASFDTKSGDLPTVLENAGYYVEISGTGYTLKDKDGKIVKAVPKGRKNKLNWD